MKDKVTEKDTQVQITGLVTTNSLTIQTDSSKGLNSYSTSPIG